MFRVPGVMGSLERRSKGAGADTKQLGPIDSWYRSGGRGFCPSVDGQRCWVQRSAKTLGGAVDNDSKQVLPDGATHARTGVPSAWDTRPIQQKYARQLAQVEPGMSFDDFSNILPGVYRRGKTSVEGEAITAYELIWRHTGHRAVSPSSLIGTFHTLVSPSNGLSSTREHPFSYRTAVGESPEGR